MGNGAGTALIIHSDEKDGKLFRELVEKSGVKYASAKNGRMGVKVFLQNPERFMFVFCDLDTRDIFGIQVVKQIRQNHPNGVIIIAFGTKNWKDQARKAGADYYFQKPQIPTNSIKKILQFE